MCMDSENSWEWGNYNEVDGTPDNSLLTSIVTDGIFGTSPSADKLVPDLGGNDLVPVVVPFVWPAQKKYPTYDYFESNDIMYTDKSNM